MDPLTGAALIGGGLNIASDLFSQTNARNAFKTRYQDTVKDMKKAGLNPALAYGQGGGNPQTSDYGEWGTSASQIAQSLQQKKQSAAQADLTQAQADLLKAQTADLKRITSARAAEAELKPQFQIYKNMSAEARSIMDMITQRQREATNASDVRAQVSRNDLAVINTELAKLSKPEAEAVARYFGTFQGRNARTIDQILDVIRTIRGGGSKTYETHNYIPGRR